MAAGIANWIGSVQHRLDSWSRQQRDRMVAAATPLPQALLQWRRRWPPWPWRWPWQDPRHQKRKLHDEHKRRREQIQALCGALKAEDAADLQDLLTAMILSECVYKRPEADLIRAVNKFKSDFGEHLAPLERIQPSLDHVQHRYVLAEAGDALFASFIGTKKYKDVIADANILQGAIFRDDDSYDLQGDGGSSVVASSQLTGSLNSEGRPGVETLSMKDRSRKRGPKPAAHRGFLARAKGIPAIELYKLAQKRERRLVLCGHSLGGAVAVLTTLAILKVFAPFSTSKSGSRIQVKCITFSQPPVGNAALRDYVHREGWQRHFRTYCIPEDIVPRILSPAYFHHYREQACGVGQQSASDFTWVSNSDVELVGRTAGSPKLKSSDRLVLGLGPLQNSLWRISKLVPLVGVSAAFRRDRKVKAERNESISDTSIDLVKNEEMPQSLELQEGAEAVALVSLSPSIDLTASEQSKAATSIGIQSGPSHGWRNRVPSFPSYVPFGQLFLLEKTSVEPLSASEYTQLSSVQSVLMEVRERFQSHTMRSYRARFQKIYDTCVHDGAPPLFTVDHVPHLPHLQQWLGLRGSVVTEIGRIVEPLVICTATSLVPLGWCRFPSEKKQHEPLLVDVQGYGLHLCTLVKAQVNGQWCCTTIESLPQPLPAEKVTSDSLPKFQKMRIKVGAPLQRPPHEQVKTGLIASTSAASESMSGPDLLSHNFTTTDRNVALISGNCQAEGLCQVMIQCSSDFLTASKEVVVRLRRVQLLGLEGAGKTSLFYALLGQGTGIALANGDGVFSNNEWQEGVAEGVSYIDPAGVNLQDLVSEVNQLKGELSVGSRQLSKRLDLVILVHNLAHKIPQLRQTPNHMEAKPVLSLLIDEVVAAGVPLILSLTNKFAVSAERLEIVARRVREIYKIPSNMSIIVNSCPHVVHGIGSSSSVSADDLVLDPEPKGTNVNSKVQGAVQKLMFAPLRVVQMPFRKKEIVLPIEGVRNLHALVHKVLLSHESDAFEELAREQLLHETKKEQTQATKKALGHDLTLPTSAAAAAGAGFGLFIALLAAAASSLKKP